MKFGSLPYRNLSAYRRYYRLTALAVVIAVGVITGSFLVGDSVRTTLVRRVAERLGDIETVIFSRGAYMDEALASRWSSRGVLLVEGFVSRGGKLIPVTVWGVDDMQVGRAAALVNTSLADELGDETEDIVLRLPSGGLVPSGSLFVTKNYTTSLRLSHGGTVATAEGGDISLRNEQTRPLNIFVERALLAETLDAAGKINLILSPELITEKEFAEVWTPASSGLIVRKSDGLFEVTSERIFIPGDVVESVSQNSAQSDRLFSYLVNSIAAAGDPGGEAIPYSFATATESYGGERLGEDEAIVSDYAARRLGVRKGDELKLTWFRSGDMKTLSVDSITLRVGRIVPLDELAADGGLSADFPGLSDVERCTDWDSDLPLDMSLITNEDERYWERWRDTPKIIVPYSAVVQSWGNDYGTATAVRVTGSPPDTGAVTPGMMGVEVIHPRQGAMAAARGGVDFSSLFLALGCFIVAAAMLLMTMPLIEMLRNRRREFAVMSALGFTPRRTARMVWNEAAPVVFASALAGTLAGILYTAIVMWLLGNLWRGATHTGEFFVRADALSLGVGFAVGTTIALTMLGATIRRRLRSERRIPFGANSSTRRGKVLAVGATLLVAASIAINLAVFDSVAGFVVTGALFIMAAVLWADLFIFGKGMADGGRLHRNMLASASLGFCRGQAIRSLVALSAGVFIVFSVGLNRKSFDDHSQIRSGTGGYTLWGESSVPIYHSLSTDEGRRALSLGDLPSGTRILQCMRYGADDASCLNLNRVSTPTVLGVDMKALDESDFEISESIDGVAGFDSFSVRTGDVYHALVDETVLKWSLGARLGDTLRYRSGHGGEAAIVLAGTLVNSVFQGNILIDRALFGEIWPENAGSELFLAAVPDADAEPAKLLLSQALAEYGVRVSTTADRLRELNSVTDTYLSIFFTLGCLGLLLGVASFIVAVRKNLASRGDEIRLLGAMGYPQRVIVGLLYRENVIVPLFAIATGVIGAVVGAAGDFAAAGWSIWLATAFFTAIFIASTAWFVRRLSVKEVDRTTRAAATDCAATT